MSIKRTLTGSAGLLVALAALAPASAGAASTFSDGLWQFASGNAASVVNFNKGGSNIYDTGDMHIATDNYLYLDAPGLTTVESSLGVQGTTFIYNGGFHGTGSRIYDNSDLHVATDNNLYLDAPGLTTVQGALTAAGLVTGSSGFTGNLTGNVTGNTTGLHTGNVSGNVSGAAATVTGAAQSAITSVGTLTGLNVVGAPAGDGTGLINADSSLSTTGTGVYGAASKGKFTLGAGYGSSTFTDPSIGFGMWGQIVGANLAGTSNYTAGTAGIYKITGTNASTFAKAGVLGAIGGGTTTADAAVMAELDGDTGVTTARAGYGIMTLNSNGGSGFDYGMDLKLQVTAGQEGSSQPFKKADIRLSSSQEVYSGSATTRAAVRAQAGTQGAIGSVYLSSAGKLYLKVAAGGADTDWQRVTATVAD